MIYTASHGVDKQMKARLFRGTTISLPLLALLFLVIAIFSFSSRYGAGQNPYIQAKPKNLSTSLNSQNKSESKPSASNSSSSTPPAPTAAAPTMSINSLGSNLPSSDLNASLPTVGGLGGGEATTPQAPVTSSSPSGTGTGVNIGTSGTTVSTCVDALGKQILCAQLDP
ncbi:MAG TPA: hypothetical protein VFT49_03690 [Candidatus Saccharimonadales bacterium]|nr:hypothetical protein [Candidatus Saccharimonadales bacterium]